MLMKTKKKKSLKFKNLKKQKNHPEIQWIGTFPQNLALIRLMVSEKMRFTDGRTSRRTPCATTFTCKLCRHSQAELKIKSGKNNKPLKITLSRCDILEFPYIGFLYLQEFTIFPTVIHFGI